ncbi:hypothetical protein [Helicobacter heilmannii]|uniref:hypothetical protein n=1 Tax=Helicobacter heilmannii TaxID=35817 RepID=UPI0018F80166|nr:hypothetical protein [Helicobacter heilmannii]
MYELATLNLSEKQVLLKQIDEIIEQATRFDHFAQILIQNIHTNPYPQIKDILSTLVVLMDVFKNGFLVKYLHEKWLFLKKIILELPHCTRAIKAIHGDARHLPLENESVDMVLTSPPYINVFNYHQNYRASVELLGYNVLTIAKSEFGANRKHRGNRLLTVIQYCIDMALTLKEICRVSKMGARLVFVVGRESNVLGYSFYNSALIHRIALEVLGLSFLLRQERMYKNRYGKMIYEDIIHLTKNKILEVSDDLITTQARKIAINALYSKYYLDNPNKILLEEAIKSANKVNPSEISCLMVCMGRKLWQHNAAINPLAMWIGFQGQFLYIRTGLQT